MIVDSYYLDTAQIGAGDDDTAIKYTDDELKQQTTFAGFDFDTVWTMDSNTGYPYPELQDVEMEFTKTLSHIAVTTQPNKLEYIVGVEAFDPTGGKVTLYYTDDTSEEIDLTIDMVSGFDAAVLGEQYLTVTYSNCTTAFTVAIVSARPFAGSGTEEDPYLIADCQRQVQCLQWTQDH